MSKIIFFDNKIISIDISVNNGAIDYEKMATSGVSYVTVRSSFGIVEDSAFRKNWTGLRGKLCRRQYHYLDYYSHLKQGTKVYGLSDAEWGKRQAQFVYALTKEDNDGSIIWLDIEKSSCAASIEKELKRVIMIAVAFFAELDRLTGRLNGVYISIGLVGLLAKNLGKRPLWVAWYNEKQTVSSVTKEVRRLGWTGILYTWQYASHGDINGDGKPDGTRFGCKEKFLDLNIEILTQEIFDMSFTVTPQEHENKKQKTRTIEVGITLVDGQNLRKLPSYSASKVSTINSGKEVDLLGWSIDTNGNTWVKLGPDLWAAFIFEGRTFIKRVLE